MTWIEGLLLLLAGVAGCAPWPTAYPYGPRLCWLLVGVVGILVLVRSSGHLG